MQFKGRHLWSFLDINYRILGENKNYGTPTNPQKPSHVPGGSSSGSAVAVAAQIVDFSLGTDTVGCIRVPASFCGILGFRPSHGIVSTVGVLPNSQSLDTVGCLASDPSVLHRAGHALLSLNPLEPKRIPRIMIADDLFQISNMSLHKIVHIIGKVTEKLSGYQAPKNMNFSQYLASKVPSLKSFQETSTRRETGGSDLRALSCAMHFLHRWEFETNHKEWVKSIKPKLGRGVSSEVWPAIKTAQENVKSLYQVRTEMRLALRSLLQDDGLLVIPTVADPPPKLNSKKSFSAEFLDRMYALSGIASMSGGCQVAIPFGEHDGCPISVSLIAYHGSDKLLLDTVLDMYSSLQEEVSIIFGPPQLPETNGNMGDAELLKEKGNVAYNAKQWNKAANLYTDAINLDGLNATYYCNRAASYLMLRCFEKAEEDCTKALSLDKRYVKAYLRRAKAREELHNYTEALKDFKLALVFEPQHKIATQAVKRLTKLVS
ncbi:outer envelope protein 64, mitochondrial isoform X2 [Andrographis paniculata]|uniref:outer envelope protein 64, mitochondrial isoform X2 n=1 Tax=Andrographis paniculata TaxID=175694 RepID=UPI0021E8A649|nr:outer envelope protein 64, mitochondrial isoform X2 [Andrographis paniculata]